MSQQILDSDNVVNSLANAPDKLRAEIGKYYSSKTNLVTGEISLGPIRNHSSDKILSNNIKNLPDNDQLLIPVKNAEIEIIARSSNFRDMAQWETYVKETIQVDQQFLDHTFSLPIPNVVNEFVKNSHHPEYEDSTKVFPSNQLLNYNLISYPYDSESVKRIGYIKTPFDQIPTNEMKVETLIDQFSNRIGNYSGSASEIEQKQRNIFNINSQPGIKSKNDFPFYYSKGIYGPTPTSVENFKTILFRNKKLKNILQLIKKDLSFSFASFNINGNTVQGKIYNAIELLTSTSLNSFSESTDEIFLLPENEVSHNSLSERFVRQVDTINFLSEMRSNLKTRKLTEIFKCKNAESFHLGYKIEKYIDHTANQPIQTYYITNNRLVDTQIKYGRKYIYKTKILFGIFGSSYSYKNLKISESPDGFKAKVDVNIVPSFQILEFEIDNHEIAFVDTPTLKPDVEIFGNKGKPLVNFLLQPRLFTMGDLGEAADISVGDLRPSDKNIFNLYNLSGQNKTSPEYFTGIYEVYRLDYAPKDKYDFADGFLATLDESITVGKIGESIETVSVAHAYYSDNIVPNKKYYYVFRTLSYHGTPSVLSDVFEIELQKDSDEYKILVNPYHYPRIEDFTYKKSAKRILQITPNIERLLFSKEISGNNFEIDDASLVSSAGSGKSFKIRVTSKHTGKKFDINLRFKLNKDQSFHRTQ